MSLSALLPLAITAGEQIFGGDGGGGGDQTLTGNCPGQPTAQVASLFAAITPTDLEAFAKGHPDPKFQAAVRRKDAQAVAYFLAGGQDCVVKSQDSLRWVQQYNALASKYLSEASSGGAPVQDTDLTSQILGAIRRALDTGPAPTNGAGVPGPSGQTLLLIGAVAVAAFVLLR